MSFMSIKQKIVFDHKMLMYTTVMLPKEKTRPKKKSKASHQNINENAKVLEGPQILISLSLSLSLSEVTGMCLLQVKSRGPSGKMCTLQNMGSFSKQLE